MLLVYAESVDIRAFQRLYVDTYLAICGHLLARFFNMWTLTLQVLTKKYCP